MADLEKVVDIGNASTEVRRQGGAKSKVEPKMH
jgi:hypothetical protein